TILTPRYEPLSPEVVKACEKAGAEVGYPAPREWAATGFGARSPRSWLYHRYLIPAFRIDSRTDLTNLPTPPAPFGMCYKRTAVPATDANVLQLSKFPQLHTLSLWNTQVTDVGMK